MHLWSLSESEATSWLTQTLYLLKNESQQQQGAKICKDYHYADSECDQVPLLWRLVSP